MGQAVDPSRCATNVPQDHCSGSIPPDYDGGPKPLTCANTAWRHRARTEDLRVQNSGRAGDVTGARDLFVELLADHKRVLGPDHPDTLATRSNVASWAGEAGDVAGARDLLVELLVDQERVLGPGHPDTLTTRNNQVHWSRRMEGMKGSEE
jgi:hypothetical protein